MKRAAFLDRDGVVNRAILLAGVPKSPTSIKDVEILGGVVEAIEMMKNHNFVPVVVTNQPDVARGIVPQLKLNQINDYIGDATGIEYFYSCFHDDSDGCDCRKPLPGLLLRAAQENNLDVANSFIVGDRWRDISAGQAAGCRAFFIDYSYLEKRPNPPFTLVSSLLEATKIMTGGLFGTQQ